MKETIGNLVNIRHKVFEEALNYFMKNESKEINEMFVEGEIVSFKLSDMDNSSDVNLQLLVDLVKKIETTTNTLANLNKIDLAEFGIK